VQITRIRFKPAELHGVLQPTQPPRDGRFPIHDDSDAIIDHERANR
jgi:hypothetical protein